MIDDADDLHPWLGIAASTTSRSAVVGDSRLAGVVAATTQTVRLIISRGRVVVVIVLAVHGGVVVVVVGFDSSGRKLRIGNRFIHLELMCLFRCHKGVLAPLLFFGAHFTSLSSHTWARKKMPIVADRKIMHNLLCYFYDSHPIQ